MKSRFVILLAIVFCGAIGVLAAQDASVPPPAPAAQQDPDQAEGTRRVREHEAMLQAIINQRKAAREKAAADGKTADPAAPIPKAGMPEAPQVLIDKFTSLMKLFTNREVEKILSNFDQGFQIVTPDGAIATDRQSLEKNFADIYTKDTGLLQRIEIDPGDVKVSMNGEFVFLTAESVDKFVSREGHGYEMKAQWTGVAHLADGTWKFVALTHTADILRNPMMKEAVDASRLHPLVSGVMGVLVGLCGGWAFFTLRSSRRGVRTTR